MLIIIVLGDNDDDTHMQQSDISGEPLGRITHQPMLQTRKASTFHLLLLFRCFPSHARTLGCDAASCSCRCWPCAALARLFIARAHPIPPSPPSRFSFAPISLSPRQALVAPCHQAAPLPLGCSLLLVEHHHHRYHCTCQTLAINQYWRGFRCKSLTAECIAVVSGRVVVIIIIIIIEWFCEVRSNTSRYEYGGVGYAAPLRTHLDSLTLSSSLVCLLFLHM